MGLMHLRSSPRSGNRESNIVCFQFPDSLRRHLYHRRNVTSANRTNQGPYSSQVTT